MSNIFPNGVLPPMPAAVATVHWLSALEAPIYRGASGSDASASTADPGDAWHYHMRDLQCDPPTHYGCKKGNAVSTEAPESPHSQHSGSTLPSPACVAPIHVPTPAHTSASLAADNAVAARRAKASQGCDPSWPFAIAKVHFFAPCARHANMQKNECHFYCVGCTPTTKQPMCQHCLPEHSTTCRGACFQVYRYMYNDVIRTADFGRLHPLGDIQAYRANGNCAVHLRPRDMPKTKSPAGFTGRCGGCARHLSPDWTYCSLACKLGIEGGCGSGAGAAVGRGEVPAATKTASQRAEPPPHATSDDESNGRATSGAVPRTRGGKRGPGAAAIPTGAKRRKPAFPQRSSSV